MKVLNKWKLIILDPQEIVGLYCPRKCHNKNMIHLLIQGAKRKAQEADILNKQTGNTDGCISVAFLIRYQNIMRINWKYMYAHC